jgi:hypothetical protein
MKHPSILFLVAAGLLAGLAPLHSQTPRGSTPQRLQTLKQQNATLLERQAAALLKLEELQKEAAQLRILARRT